MSNFRLEVTESSIDKWLREFQRRHGDLRHIGLDELRELAYALHDDVPMGYEASMRLADWLLHVAPMPNGKTCHADETDTWEYVCELPVEGMVSFVSGTTTIPVHERIVRCRDCKHCREHDMRAYGGDRDQLLCHHFSMSSGAGWPVEPDGFCKWGVRRADG